MAKKDKVTGVALLPSGRAIRVVKLDARRMLELTERVGVSMPQPVAGQAPDPKAMAKASSATQQAMIAMCVRGITLEPVTFVYKKRETTAEERAGGAPEKVDDVVDVDATLDPYTKKESPEFKRWVPLGEMEFENDTDENTLSMFNLFEDHTEWTAVLVRIKHAGGGTIIDPFAGKMLKTSAG